MGIPKIELSVFVPGPWVVFGASPERRFSHAASTALERQKAEGNGRRNQEKPRAGAPPPYLLALPFEGLTRERRYPLAFRLCVQFPEKFETPPAIPRQEIERKGEREKQDRERHTHNTPSAVGRGDGAGNTGSPLHRLTRQPVFQLRTPYLTPPAARG